MSLPNYIINWDELLPLLKELFGNTMVRGMSDIRGEVKVQGYRQRIPAMNDKFILVEFVVEEPIILSAITYSQSAWRPQDYWEMLIGGDKVFNKIYTKELGERKEMKSVNLLGKGEKITIILNNDSGTSKDVWVDIEYIKLSL